MYTKEYIRDYSELLKFSFLHGESGIDIAIKSTERHSQLAVKAMQYLEKEMRSGEISIGEPHAQQLLDFVEAVYFLCLHEEGAPYHRRDLENWMQQLAADNDLRAS